jgi:hypothetical protein
MDSVPETSGIIPVNHMSATCDSQFLTLRINKCVMNKFGFKLAQLYIGSYEKSAFDSLVSANNPACRGRIGYEDGPEYVFKIDRSKDECNLVSEVTTKTHVMYKSGIQASKPVSSIEFTDTVSKTFLCFFINFSKNLKNQHVQVKIVNIQLMF